MRTFLAVSPPEDAAREIHSSRAPLRRVWKGVRWVIPEHFHITLVFLGERDRAVVDGVRASLSPIIGTFPCFDVGFDGVGCFGPPSHPKLIFEHIGVGSDALLALHQNLRVVLEPLIGWERRSFRPHLTLGRPKRGGTAGPEDGGLLPPGTKTDNVGTFRATEVILYRSDLLPDGARYSILDRWPLKEAS